MNLKKKATVEVQFNWIYVAIAGGVILLIVISLINGIRTSSKSSMEYEAINYFDEIFTSMQGSENTEHSVTLPGMEIEFDTARTGEEQCNFYRIKGSSMQGQDISYTPIFSPDIIQKRVLSYSLGWDVPFRANYFLYITSPDAAYVLVGGKLNDLYMDLPNHMAKEKGASTDDFVNQNYYKVRYVLYNSEPGQIASSVSKLKDKEVSAVNIIPSNGLYGFGTVKFYQKEGDELIETGEAYYLDKVTLFAAIYSDGIEDYKCNLMKAIKRLNMLSSLLKSRVATIQKSDLLPLCTKESYNNAQNSLSQLESITDEIIKGEISLNKMQSINSIKNGLQALNTDLNRKSCPTVY